MSSHTVPAVPVLHVLQQARRAGTQLLALLLDPDQDQALEVRLAAAHRAQVDMLLIGGSYLQTADTGRLEALLSRVAALSPLPRVLFPGGTEQLCTGSDALLLLSLISGRNPELLIGQHVRAAPRLAQLAAQGTELLPTGYMLVDTGRLTTAAYVSSTPPLPADKPMLAAYTALAGQLLGLQLLYLDAGSGAAAPVSPAMVRAIRATVALPLIVGGGIRSAEEAQALYDAGADMLVIGTALEQDPASPLLQQLATRRMPAQPILP